MADGFKTSVESDDGLNLPLTVTCDAEHPVYWCGSEFNYYDFKFIQFQSERSSFSHVLEGNEDMTRRNNVMASQWHAIVKGMIEKTRPHLPSSLRTLLPIWYKGAQPLYSAEGGAYVPRA